MGRWVGRWCKPTLVFIFRPSVELASVRPSAHPVLWERLMGRTIYKINFNPEVTSGYL